MYQFKHPPSLATFRLIAAAFVLLFCGGVCAAEKLTVAATGTVMPMLKILLDDFAKQDPKTTVELLYPPAGSGGAIRGVATGKVDLGVVARRPRPDLPGAELLAIPWAKTAFVIVANHGAVNKSYTLEELAAIWSGTLTAWPDGRPMRLVLRTADDADIAALRAMSPAMNRAVDAALARPGLPRAEHDLHNLEMLEKVPGAIGGSTLGLMLSSGSRLTMLNIAGVTPNPRSLQDGSYPYQRTLFLVSHDRHRNHPFVVYLRSARAYVLLETHGFVKPAP